MANKSDGNVHALEYRETKPSQGDPARPVSDLFRLDNRTILSIAPKTPSDRLG